MFHSQWRVRPERKKRSLPFQEDAPPAPPDGAKLVSRSSTVGQVSACEKNVPFPFQTDPPVEPTLQGKGAAGHGLVKLLKNRRVRLFRSGREGIAERPLGYTHPTEIYLC